MSELPIRRRYGHVFVVTVLIILLSEAATVAQGACGRGDESVLPLGRGPESGSGLVGNCPASRLRRSIGERIEIVRVCVCSMCTTEKEYQNVFNGEQQFDVHSSVADAFYVLFFEIPSSFHS